MKVPTNLEIILDLCLQSVLKVLITDENIRKTVCLSELEERVLI
ncbi:hypothetical protein M153_5610001570 [Pseudoloma neurophilia]|uniref:Uncharacterized protein n=1 Tax=Pseudoloma neurophilia TaxID=146866 RepID=A0A0R0LWS0_9MICR|nr:hypothetical protein M153_5610001570 [Pseudoloma neurophilia]